MRISSEPRMVVAQLLSLFLVTTSGLAALMVPAPGAMPTALAVPAAAVRAPVWRDGAGACLVSGGQSSLKAPDSRGQGSDHALHDLHLHLLEQRCGLWRHSCSSYRAG